MTSKHPSSHAPDPTITGPAATSEGGQPSSHPPTSSQLASLKIGLHRALRYFPDFPTPGIVFADILPIFADAELHEQLVKALELHIVETYGSGNKPDVIVGLEARGFLFAPSLALRLGSAFVPVRKKGKMPGPTVEATYMKEYGPDLFQMQADGIRPGQRVVVVDDIIATGGSAAAAGDLVKQLGGNLLGYVFILELSFLKGREKLPAPAHTLLSSQEDGKADPS